MKKFSHWIKWHDRNTLENIKLPGVYFLAISDQNISNASFSWRSDIVYVGMTNSRGGLKSRLQQFDNTIKGKVGHGGAQRFMRKYPNYDELKKRLYVSVCPTNCNVNSKQPKDLRLMGSVAAQEYECFARYVEIYRQLPEFNDMKRSPKK
jgi:hypothetical protein